MPSNTTNSFFIVSSEIHEVSATVSDGNCRNFSCLAIFFLDRSNSHACVTTESISASESDAMNAIEAALTRLDEFVSAMK